MLLGRPIHRERLRDLLGLIDTDGMTRDQGWRADLRLLAREIKRRAYAPFAFIPEEGFDRETSATFVGEPTRIAPDIYVPPAFEAFSRNEDPAMKAILALREHFPGC